jgi:hypothetical protein
VSVQEPEAVVAQRQADLGGWELYRVVRQDDDDAVCVVALRAAARADEGVLYGVYRGADAEPSASGTIGRVAAPWSDAAREAVLREILAAYVAQLPALAGPLGFDFGASAGEEG